MSRIAFTAGLVFVISASALFVSFPAIAGTSVVAWGSNAFGQTNVPPDLTNVVAVAAGDRYSLALLSDGTIAQWGSPFPSTNTTASLSNVVAIAALGVTALALRQDGTVVGWGSGGLNNVPPDSTNVVAIATDGSHFLALKLDGRVIAWGSNTGGVTNVPGSLSNVVAIAAGGTSAFALESDGTIASWGSQSAVYPTNLTNIIAVSGSTGHGIALNSDGTVTVWGSGTELQVPTDLTNAINVSFNWFNQPGSAWAVRRDGRLAGWSGDLGNTNFWMNLSNVLALSVGYFHQVAIVGDGWAYPVPTILNVNRSNSVFQIAQPTVRGRSYILEYRASIEAPYSRMLPPVPGDGSIRTMTDPDATASQRFYRVRQQP